MRPLYTPPDLLAANVAWGANCGPGALAALLRRPLATVARCFPDYRGFANPTSMKQALNTACASFLPFWIAKGADAPGPARGLLFIQFDGPWCGPGVDPRAAYRHTHWIAVETDEQRRRHVYDVNVGEAGGWLPRETWLETIVPELVAGTKRAMGWYPRFGVEVARSPIETAADEMVSSVRDGAGRKRILQATVARRGIGDAWWLMSRRETGWASFGYPHASLADIEARWAVTLGAEQTDEHGVFVEATPIVEGGAR